MKKMNDAMRIQKAMEIKRKKKNATFEVITENCCRAIRRCADAGRTSVCYPIPPILHGYPLYDIQTCVEYVVRRLQSMGYNTRIIGDGTTMDVSWGAQCFRNSAPVTTQTLPTADKKNHPPNQSRPVIVLPVSETHVPKQREDKRVCQTHSSHVAPHLDNKNMMFPPTGMWTPARMNSTNTTLYPKVPHRKEEHAYNPSGNKSTKKTQVITNATGRFKSGRFRVDFQ